MVNQNGNGKGTKNSPTATVSQPGAGDGAGSEIDWKARHDGQLKKVQSLTQENETLRRQAGDVAELKQTVAGLAKTVAFIEETTAEVADRVSSQRSVADPYDDDDDDDVKAKPSDAKAAQVRARRQAQSAQGFAERLNRAYNAIKENFVEGMVAEDPLVVEARADYEAGRKGDVGRLELAVEKIKLARRAAEANRPTPTADDSGDGESNNNDATGDEDDEVEDDEQTPPPSKRRQLARSGALAEQSGGGNTAPTDLYAEASPLDMFKAAGKGEGPQRS